MATDQNLLPEDVIQQVLTREGVPHPSVVLDKIIYELIIHGWRFKKDCDETRLFIE